MSLKARCSWHSWKLSCVAVHLAALSIPGAALGQNVVPASGPVGLGTATPDQQLTVAGLVEFQVGTATAANPWETSTLPFGVAWRGLSTTGNPSYPLTSPFPIASSISSASSGNFGGNLQFFTRGDNGGPLTERVRMTSIGNVGIGTQNVYSTLHVYNGSSVALGSNPNLWLGKNSDTSYAQMAFGFSDSASAFAPAAIAFKQNDTNGNDQSGDLLFAIGANRTASPPELMRLTASGRLGIGTSSPQFSLDVNGTARFAGGVSSSTGQTLQFTGTPSAPTYPAVGSPITAVTGVPVSPGNQWSIALGPNVGYGYYSAIGFDGVHFNNGDQAGDLFFATSPFPGNGAPYAPPQERMRITASGLVEIGTNEQTCATVTTAPCKLAVTGAIVAQEVVVNSSGADYVFAPGYRLAPLSEVSQFVKANHHLPEIPSATEVAEKGVNLGEMQAKLLAKIEELTLHMIQANEEIEKLKQRNEALERRLDGSR